MDRLLSRSLRAEEVSFEQICSTQSTYNKSQVLDDFGQKMCNEMRIANAIVKMDFMSPGNEFTESNTPKKKDGGGGLDAVTNREKKPSIGMILFLFR